MKRQDEQFQANLEQQYAQAELEATEQTIMAVGDAAGTIATGGAGMANPSLGGAAANSFA